MGLHTHAPLRIVHQQRDAPTSSDGSKQSLRRGSVPPPASPAACSAGRQRGASLHREVPAPSQSQVSTDALRPLRCGGDRRLGGGVRKELALRACAPADLECPGTPPPGSLVRCRSDKLLVPVSRTCDKLDKACVMR